MEITGQSRVRGPCTTYKREGRTKQNVYECLPSGTVEYQTVCPPAGGRTGQEVYECCPPTPVELRCSVCWTAERDSCNIWSCVPYISYSRLCGPTLADLLIYLLNLLPLSFLACLGIAHPRCCTAKPKPCKPCVPCIPDCKPPPPPPRCVPVNRCAPCPEKREVRKCGPCLPTNTACNPCNPRRYDNPCDRVIFEGGDGYNKDDYVVSWMHDEYESLARELAEIKRLTNDDDSSNNDRDLLQARNYVLDRLAEMLAKREEIEKRIEKKKQMR